jgi:peptide/nickel transport system substrate-binding protein
MRKNYISFFFLYFLFFLLLFYTENTLIYLRSVDSTTLEPGKTEELYSSEVIANIFEGLVRYKKGSSEVEPCLATSWKMNRDGTEWTFFLRNGVRFHNGSAFDSSSVVMTFENRLLKGESDQKRLWYFLPTIKDVIALDKYTVKICLKKPYTPLLLALTDPIALIVAPESFRKDGFVPIGTGPFKFDSWNKGNYLIIRKNEDYWDGNVIISQVVFKVVKNATSKTLQLRNGNADILRIDSATEYDEFLGRKEIEILTAPIRDVHYLAFNTRKPFFSRVVVRLAIAHLINKEGLVKHIYQKVAIPAINPIPPNFFGFNRNIKDYDYNIPKAKLLLKEAGLERGFVCKLFFTEKNAGLQKIANIITANAKKVNIVIKKIPMPFKELVKRCDRGEHDLVLHAWVGAADPDFFFYPLFTMKEGNKNRAFYSNPVLTELLEKARETFDSGLRSGYYYQVQEIIHRDVPWIPLFHQKSMVAHRKKIKNLYINPNDYMIFRYVKKVLKKSEI